MARQYKAYFLAPTFVALLLTSQSSFAITLGEMADNLLGPAGGITTLMYGVSYVAGSLMLLMALLQYKAHRDNPSQVRLGTPIALFIFAIVFICIPIVSKYSVSSKATTTSIDTQDNNNAPLLFGREIPQQQTTTSSPQYKQQSRRPNQPAQQETTTVPRVHTDDSDWY